jgi:hypothetical protein
MPKNLTVELASGQRFEVRRRLAGRDLPRNEPRRLERIRLLSRGMTAPQVAGLVECDPVTVRDAVRRFTCGGFDALADAPRPGRPGSAWCWEQPPAVAEIGALIGRAGVAVTVRVVPYGQAKAPRTGTVRGAGAAVAASLHRGDALHAGLGEGGQSSGRADLGQRAVPADAEAVDGTGSRVPRVQELLVLGRRQKSPARSSRHGVL